MNKFAILNTMQRSVKRLTKDTWSLSVNYTHQGVTRNRVTAYICSSKDGKFYVTRTASIEGYKNFMSALAALMTFFIKDAIDLVKSMRFGLNDQIEDLDARIIADVCGYGYKLTMPKVERPSIPVYDRGPKKEVLHPLRRAVTKFFGGNYHR